jgi:hypothetical protein
MLEAYLIAAIRGTISSLPGDPRAGQAWRILRELLGKTGVPARRVQALHWHGGDEGSWISSLCHSPRDGESQKPAPGFPPKAALFQWPAAPLLAHASLQSVARAIEAGDTDLVILAQECGGQVVACLLASPALVGIYNLSPQAVIRRKLASSSADGGLIKAAATALPHAGRDGDEPEPAGPCAAEVEWLAASSRPEPSSQAISSEDGFPAARWLDLDPEDPTGDLFLLLALLNRLGKEKARWGLLLSEGRQRSGLATCLERI